MGMGEFRGVIRSHHALITKPVRKASKIFEKWPASSLRACLFPNKTSTNSEKKLYNISHQYYSGNSCDDHHYGPPPIDNEMKAQILGALAH